MAYDQGLAARIRKLVGGRRGLSEREMFGGLAFMRDGKMFAGVLGDELMARVGKDAHDAWAAEAGARLMDFTGRPMRGYLFVKPAGLRGPARLARWVEACWEHVAGLKKAARPKRSR